MMLKILFEGFDFATGGSLQWSIDSDMGVLSVICVIGKTVSAADTVLLFKYVIVNPDVSDLVVPWIVRYLSLSPSPLHIIAIRKQGVLRNSHTCIDGGNVLVNHRFYSSITEPSWRS